MMVVNTNRTAFSASESPRRRKAWRKEELITAGDNLKKGRKE